MAEILASVDDVNANLPSEDFDGSGAVVAATQENTALLQLSVARAVRGYLGGVITQEVMMAWTSPDLTPDYIREAAAKLIASQLFMQRVARTVALIDARHFAQVLYDQAIDILQRIVDGLTIIEDTPVIPVDALTMLDFFPVDDTDRAFSMSLEL